MADAHEESSEDFSDSTSSDNFSIYTETSSSEEDLQNVEEIKGPGRLLHRSKLYKQSDANLWTSEMRNFILCNPILAKDPK